MRTTIDLDEPLVQEAVRLTGIRDRTALIHEGLRALIARESALPFPVFEVSPDAPPLTLETVREALGEE